MDSTWRKALAIAGAVAFGLTGTSLGSSGVGHASPASNNIVESNSITGQYAHDFSNACVAGYYGQSGKSSLQGNHSESDLALNPKTGSLLGASKFFFGSTADAGYTDFSPQYLFHLGSYSITASGSGSNTIIPGYSDGPTCQGSGDSTGKAWTDATDPNIAFNSNGDAFTAVLPFTLYTNSQPNGAIYVNKMASGASTWSPPVLASPLYASNGTGQGPDKQWVATYNQYVNACWTVFTSWASQVYCSRSSNGGASFANAGNPVQISDASSDGPFNTYVYPRYDSTGTLYVTYMAEKHEPAIDSVNPSAYQNGNTGTVYTVVSRDHGATFSSPVRGPSVQVLPYQLPNTTFRDGISYYMNASQTYPGRLFVATEDYSAGNANVYLYESRDGGSSWTTALRVNDFLPGSDHFQPTVTTDSAGNVAVAWYDRRNACPATQSLTPGAANTCVDTYVQFYKDGTQISPNGTTLTLNGGNTRTSQYTWDPQLPQAPAQANCPNDLPHPDGSCSISFIGDYFGATLGNGNLYVLNVSTHNFGGNGYNDQQQVLQIVPVP